MHAPEESPSCFQCESGQYNKQAWRGFDYVMAQAALHDIRVCVKVIIAAAWTS